MYIEMRSGRNQLHRRTRLRGQMLRTVIALVAAVCMCAQTRGLAPERRSGGTEQTSEPGSVRGTVVSSAGEPLRKAEVTLRSLGNNRGGPPL